MEIYFNQNIPDGCLREFEMNILDDLQDFYPNHIMHKRENCFPLAIHSLKKVLIIQCHKLDPLCPILINHWFKYYILSNPE
jgi:hypothetical protein